MRRYVSFIFILFIIAFGTSLSIRANLGSSPISTPPYVLSLVPGIGLTMGELTICMHIFFILSQMILLRKDYDRLQLTQLLVSFLFGFYTDMTMWLTGFLQIPFTMNPLAAYPLRLTELLIGGGLLAFGIASEVRCDSLMLAGEGFPLAIAKFLKKDFGKVKICSDTGLVCVGIVLLFIFFGHWDWKMVGIGTLISMFYVGIMVRVFSSRITWLDRIFIPADERHLQATDMPLATPHILHPVITIARQYGCGGHLIAQRLSERLGINYYDKDIIDHTAMDLGYTSEFVAQNEQNISTSKLWELIISDSGIPASMNPSEDDAIFVSQSRAIRELAHEGPCIIIGRLGNRILRDQPGVFRVFVTSDEEFAIKNVIEKDQLSAEKARRKIELVNRGRANHYWKYTNRQWTDLHDYDLVVNTTKLGLNGAVDVIANGLEQIKNKSFT